MHPASNEASWTSALSRNFMLPRQLTIENAQTLFAQITEHKIMAGAAFNIDASEVTVITSPGVQLVVSLAKTVTAQGGRFAITATSPEFIETFKTLGLIETLGTWEKQ